MSTDTYIASRGDLEHFACVECTTCSKTEADLTHGGAKVLYELLKTEEPSNVDSVRSGGVRDTHNETLDKDFSVLCSPE